MAIILAKSFKGERICVCKFVGKNIAICLFACVTFFGCVKNKVSLPTSQYEPTQETDSHAQKSQTSKNTESRKTKPTSKSQDNTSISPLKFSYQDIAPDKAQVSDYTGVITLYHANGNLAWEISFLKGRQDGATKWYYDNGKLRAQMHFVRGIANGEARSYYKSGILRSEELYENDHPIGESKLYSPKGKLQYSIYYENGKEVRKISHIK